MDTPNHLVKAISTIRDVNCYMKSFRIFRKLGTSDKEYIRHIQRESYTLADYTLILYAKGKKRYSLKDCYNLAKSKREVIGYRLFKIQLKYSKFNPKRTKDAINQLLFHSFIPSHELPKNFLRKGYAYITSSKPLNGITYFFPERLYDDWAKHTKARYCQTVLSDLAGMIRLNYSFEYKSLIKFKHSK